PARVSRFIRHPNGLAGKHSASAASSHAFSHSLGHEDAFHAVRLNGRCRIRKRSIAAGDWRRRLLRSAGARRQATWRTRQAAKLVAQAAELEVLRGRLAAASGDAGGAETVAGESRPSRGTPG